MGCPDQSPFIVIQEPSRQLILHLTVLGVPRGARPRASRTICELRAELSQRLAVLASDGVTDPEELRRLVLASFPPAKIESAGLRVVWVTRRGACFAPRVPFSRSRQAVCPPYLSRGALAQSWHHPLADRFSAADGGECLLCPSYEYALAAVSFPAASETAYESLRPGRQ